MQQRAFERIYPNPYIAGNPIRNREMFFGREDEFRFIARALEDGRKTALIVLFGERRCGKSSILYQILNGCLGQAFLPVFVDMQIMAGVAGEAVFFSRIMADACKQLNGAGLFAERYTSLPLEAATDSTFREFLQELRRRFPARAPLLLIDEYEILEAKIKEGSLPRRLLAFFAGLLETDLVSFVFTGSKSLEARDHMLWGEELFRKATARKISFLTKDDTMRLITQPLQDRVTFDPHVTAQIYMLTAGQPFYTQLICQNLVYHLNEAKKGEVTEHDVQAVVDSILENPPHQLLFNWGEHSPRRKLALSLLAEFSKMPETFLSARDLCEGLAREKLQLDLEENFFNEELASLFQDEYVLQRDRQAQREYSYRLDLYRRWVRHDHSIWQVKKEIGAHELAIITEQKRRQQEKRQKAFKILERSLEIGLTALALFFLVKFVLALQRHVIVQANGGPFSVWVDGELAGTSRDGEDSTRFEIPDRLTKDFKYSFRAVLLATGEVWTDSITVTKDDQEVHPLFRACSLEVVADAASVELRLGGDSWKPGKEVQEKWRHTFEACAGTYRLWAKDSHTGEVKDTVIVVREPFSRVRIDFAHAASFTLASNIYPIEYAYALPNSKRVEKGQAHATLTLRGLAPGDYRFTLKNPATTEEIVVNARAQFEDTSTVAFNPNWIRPGTTVKPPRAKPLDFPRTYTLRIISEPPEALVSLEGVILQHATPCETTLVAGKYALTVEKKGYAIARREIDLTGNDVISAALTPQWGYLKLIIQDEEGSLLTDPVVTIDGRQLTQQEIRKDEIRLLALRHTLRIEHRGYAAQDTFCDIGAGEVQRLLIKLRKRL